MHWEGQFIDITHKFNEALPCKITLANIYRPPRNNNSNISIDRFLEPFINVFNELTRENSILITGGDFNIDLLKINEREKFQEYFDLFVSNGSIPQITTPTRFSRKNATLLDQIFCRPNKYSSIDLSGVIATGLSDHFPCFSVISMNSKIKQRAKYIKIQKKGSQEILSFQNEIRAQLAKTTFDYNLLTDPNVNYEKLEGIIKKKLQKNAFPSRKSNSTSINTRFLHG